MMRAQGTTIDGPVQVEAEGLRHPGGAYMAMGRVRSLSNLFLTGDPSFVASSAAVLASLCMGVVPPADVTAADLLLDADSASLLAAARAAAAEPPPQVLRRTLAFALSPENAPQEPPARAALRALVARLAVSRRAAVAARGAAFDAFGAGVGGGGGAAGKPPVVSQQPTFVAAALFQPPPPIYDASAGAVAATAAAAPGVAAAMAFAFGCTVAAVPGAETLQGWLLRRGLGDQAYVTMLTSLGCEAVSDLSDVRPQDVDGSDLPVIKRRRLAAALAFGF